MTDGKLSADEVSRLRLVLLRLARRLRQNTAGMTQSQLSALASVNREGPLTMGELAAIENVQPPSISRIVGALEGEGWIQRVSDARDGRIALVQITPRGIEELARLRSDRDLWLARQVGTIDPADQAMIVEALPALERLLAASPPPATPPRPPRSTRSTGASGAAGATGSATPPG